MHFNNIISGADLGGREVGSITCTQSAFIIMQTVCACDTANLFICTVNLQTKLHKIQSHKVTFSKFSWGGMPHTLLEGSYFAFRRVCFAYCAVTLYYYIPGL